MNSQYKKTQAELEKTVTLGVLLEFTDEFLIPKMTDLVKEEVAGVEYRLKSYIDRKLSDHTAELFKRLDERYQKDRHFKQKVVELLRKHNIGASEDIAFLEGLTQ